jgi:hypothetical protein
MPNLPGVSSPAGLHQEWIGMAGKPSLRRRVVTVGALGLIGFGLWLGSKFGGFGLGDGFGLGGSGDGKSGSSESTSDKASGEPTNSGEAKVGLTGLSQPATKSAPAPTRIRVVIDGTQFLVAESDEGTTGEAATASDIAARVKEATGDDQGIRVRIERTKRATAGAQSELLQALDAAGVSRESVQQMTGFLE